ncbi:MAG: hypothetical protein IPH53_03850 [Flavobacteriales bacterium]|nr:hypothetical protein [Flavobacteriales bacterium]MBK7271496.1 hypothetical protein [Flavobacteriales bacterium]
MRTLLFASALLPLSLIAQTTFAPIGAKWSYEQHFAWGPDSNLYTLTCIGDTTILGHTCSVLDGSTTDCYFPYSGGQAYTYVSGDSVFLFDQDQQNFDLLYAFNTAVGDTWDIPRSIWNPLDTIHVEVMGTSSTSIDGSTLRVLDVEITTIYEGIGAVWPISATITERLGHAIYHFLWGYEACDMDILGPLRCYEDPDITWLNPQLPQCELGTGFMESNGHGNWSLQPNAIARNTSASLLCAEPGLVWDLLDAQGRIVSSGSASVGRTAISIARPGGYLLVLSRNGRTIGRDRVTVY